MDNIRSILVHIDAAERCQVRLRVAQDLAKACHAQLTALYAVTPMAYTVPLMMAEGSAMVLPALEEMDHQREKHTRAMFDRVSAQAEPQPSWVDAGRNPTYAAMTNRALVQDLLVLGQHDPASELGTVDADLVAATLIDSGTPAVVIPHAGSIDVDALTKPDLKIVLAWKPTREAARAMHAALPWLQRAHMIHLATEKTEAGGSWPGVAQVQSWMRLHGVKAEIKPRVTGSGDVGENLLALADEISADLLVMGCFGHSRARELLLGGASRTVLRSMTLPVLMAH